MIRNVIREQIRKEPHVLNAAADILDRIEDVCHAKPRCRHGHELHQSLCALRRDREPIEAGLRKHDRFDRQQKVGNGDVGLLHRDQGQELGTRGPGPEPLIPVLDHRPWFDDAVLRHDDHTIPDEVSMAVDVIHALLVDELRPLADAGVLVDDHAVKRHAIADPKGRRLAAGRRSLIGLIVVGTEKQRPADRRPLTNECSNAND